MSEAHIFGRQLRLFLTGLLGCRDVETERRNIETLKTLYRTFNENRIDAAVELVTDDYELTDLSSGDITRSRDAFRQRLTTGKTAFPDATAEITALHSQGDVVVAEVANRATHTGPFRLPGSDQELPPTGRKLDVVGCEIYEFRDGKIAKGRLYYDLLTLGRQLGLLPDEMTELSAPMA